MDSAYLRAPKWPWPRTAPEAGQGGPQHSNTANKPADTHQASTTATDGDPPPPPEATPPPPQPARERHYKPRTCRICLEVVEPSYEVVDDNPAASLLATSAATRLFRTRPRVRYISADAELGRLLSPCRCKGSQKYVHEGCLQAWRRAGAGGGAARLAEDRNFWRCPTCGFAYRLERLRWGRWIASRGARAALTLAVFALALFALGFVADPIISLWLDPLGSIADGLLLGDAGGGGGGGGVHDGEGLGMGAVLREELAVEDPNTWSFHFFKGIVSLGLLGFVKTFFGLFPWQWTVHRYVGGGGRRRGTGRNRLENINWGLVVVGVITFLAAVWKGISYLSSRALDKVSETVVDVQATDEPDEDDEDTPTQQNDAHSEERAKDPATPEESKKDV